MPQALDAIIFDKDGTLFDFNATWAPWAAAFINRVSNGDAELAGKVSRSVGFDLSKGSFSQDSVVIAGTPEDIVAEIAQHFPKTQMQSLIETINDEAEAAPMAEAVPLAPFLDGLKRRGLKLGVATNDAEAPAIAHLEAVFVRDRFDFIAGSDSGYGGKPAPGQLLGFAETFSLEPARVAMVGDSLHDLRAGQAAGFLCIGVLTGMAPREVLEPYADVVLPNIGHIPAWLDA